RGWAPVALDGVQQMPLPALQSAFDALYPPGDQWYWRADFVQEISDDAVAQHIEFGERLPTWKSTMHLYPIDGAASRVGQDETAWSYRDAKWAEVIVGVDPQPAKPASGDRSLRRRRRALLAVATSREVACVHKGGGSWGNPGSPTTRVLAVAGFSTEVTVRFAETDAQGVAHNANYLVWYEVA